VRKSLVAAGFVLVVAEVALPAGYRTMAGVGLLAVVAAIVDYWRHNRHPPAAFVVGPGDRSFRTPRTAGVPLLALAGGQIVAAVAARLTWPGATGVLLFGLLLAAGFSRAIWLGTGVTLRSAGIVADKVAGSLIIPWEALEAWRPVPGGEPGKLKIGYLRPGLVRSTGLVRRRDEIVFDGADRRFVAAAIYAYTTDAERRTGIGTAAEHERLRAGRPPAVVPVRTPATTRQTAGRVAGGLTLFLGGITVKTWLDDRHYWWSIVADLPAVAGFLLLVAGWQGARAARQARRAARGLRS
jgi:hypothetical protein